MNPLPRARMPIWGWVMVASFAVLFVLGVILEMRGKFQQPATPLSARPAEDAIEALRQLGSERVMAASGGFSVAAPAGWTQVTGPEAHPYQLVLYSAHGARLSFMATPVAYNDLQKLGADIRLRERDRDLATTPEIVRLEDRQVIQRRLRLITQQIVAIDFVEQRVAYHVLGSAPRELYATYEPVFIAVVKTLRAEPPAAAPVESGAAGTPGNA